MAESEAPKARIHNELGRSGLKHFSGHLYEEWLPQLQGLRGVKIYQEMSENSPTISAMLFAIEATLRGVQWAVEPATDTDTEAAEFLESCMDDMSHTWEDFISEVLTMIPFGWSYFEVVYKKRKGPDGKGSPSKFDDGKVGWRKFAPRAQNTLYRWDIDHKGGIKGMHQYPLPTGAEMDSQSNEIVFLPIERSLLFRTTSKKNSPEGRSVLRGAYRPWYFAKRIEEIEAIGIERDLAGMPIAYVPPELLAQTKSPEAQSTYDYVKDIVTRVKRDEQEGIIWPLAYDDNGNEVFKFELLSAGGKKSVDTGAVITRYTQQMAMTTLADFILLGHENVGSFALSSDKTELFAVALGAWLDAIEDVINRHAVPRLMKLNGFDVNENMPRIVHGDIEKPDLTQLIQFVTGLAQAGAPLFPDLVLENRLREIADLPTITKVERDAMLEEQMEEQMAQQQMMMGPEPSMGLQRPQPGPSGFNPQMQKLPGMPGRPQDGKFDQKQVAEGSAPSQKQPKKPGSSVQKAVFEMLEDDDDEE